MRKYINIIEPTLFTPERTYVEGPFQKWWALIRARWHVYWHTHAQVTTHRSDVLVLLDEKPLWDGRRECAPEISQGPYR